jgi:hypothetical protein
MRRLTIYTDGTISVGTTITGYRVHQTPDGTVVSRWANNGYPPPTYLGDVVTMPSPRYALSCWNCVPDSGVPNANDFDREFVEIWDKATAP